MSAGSVWVQQTGLDGVRMWHLEGSPGQTRCARPTGPMKALPSAVWSQVLNPCPLCQNEPDPDEAAAPPGEGEDSVGTAEAAD